MKSREATLRRESNKPAAKLEQACKYHSTDKKRDIGCGER
jgi:hypothetical protein